MVTVDQLTPPGVDTRLAARAHRAIEPLHSHHYFSPELDEHLAATGLRPGRMSYFAGRAAPMGAVSPGVVTATFYNFAPALVARHVPRCWTLATPDGPVRSTPCWPGPPATPGARSTRRQPWPATAPSSGCASSGPT